MAIGISGWLSSTSDVNKPWEVIDAGATEPFALRFELKAMLRLGTSLQNVLFSYAWDGLTYTVISRTLLGALYAGLWPLGLIKVASVLDNPFSVALARADKAGQVLAHALIDGVQGKRPVTLVGYSVGARVIYACLVELAEQHAFGLIESVVLMGAPAPSDSRQWRQIRSVVTARVVNVYSTEDYVLGYLYRSTKLEMGVAGLGEVQGIYGIENVDMSKLVSGHDRYRYIVGAILVKIGFGDLDFNKVAEQERALELAEKKKQRIREEGKKTEAENKELVDPERGVPTISPHATQDSSEVLFDMDKEHKPLQSRSRPQPQQQGRMIYSQNRSRQQPSTRMVSHFESAVPEQPPSSPGKDDQKLDPLGTAALIETSTPAVRKSSRPMASATNQRQMPSNLTAAKAQPQKLAKISYNYGYENHDGPIRLVDESTGELEKSNIAPSSPEQSEVAASFLKLKQDTVNSRPPNKNIVAAPSRKQNTSNTPYEKQNTFNAPSEKQNTFNAPPQRQIIISNDTLKTASIFTVAEVPAVKASVQPTEKDVETDDETYDDLTDEISSEFGELSMVEPLPLDDFDYGLM